MSVFTHKLRYVFITLLAAAMLVLAPMQSKMADSRWVEWCTAQGMTRVLVQDSVSAREDSAQQFGYVSSHVDHCALCFFEHLPLLFNALAAFVAFASLVFFYFSPASDTLYRRLRVSWARSRAPPVFSFN